MFVLLHIGKTGGSYTQHVISHLSGPAKSILFLNHSFSLKRALDEFPDRSAVFGIRAPDAIFVSGFYSRMREGKPRYNFPWSQEERLAFATFQTPNQLAESLSSAYSPKRRAAELAMSHIMHVNRGLRFYLTSANFVRTRKDRIAFILRQECLDSDIRQFLLSFGIRLGEPTITDELTRHSNPSFLNKNLSDAARCNLSHWYYQDFEIYDECLEIAESIRCENARRGAAHL